MAVRDGGPRRVLIAGGGLGGMTAALALLKRGIDVEVYEQASELREVGAGLHVSPNAFRVLHEIGVGDAVRRTACIFAGREVRLWNTGDTWPVFDLGMKAVELYGFPYFTVYRPDLLAALVDAVRAIKPDAIHLRSACSGFEQDEAGVTLQHTGGSARGDALIGADGVHSKVRQALFGPDEPQYSGLIAWRGLVPMERLPARMQRPVGTNWIGPGGHVVHYPVHSGTLMNYAGISESNGEWVAESWNAPGSVDDCVAMYPGWHSDLELLFRATDVPYKWALMIRPPLPRWRIGRVSLLGDACHATLPFLGQGAAMAMEDGFILARALQAESDVPTALQRYEDARRDRTARVVTGSSGNTKRFHNPVLADPVAARAYVDREWAPQRVQDRYEWIYTYDVTAVPV